MRYPKMGLPWSRKKTASKPEDADCTHATANNCTFIERGCHRYGVQVWNGDLPSKATEPNTVHIIHDLIWREIQSCHRGKLEGEINLGKLGSARYMRFRTLCRCCQDADWHKLTKSELLNVSWMSSEDLWMKWCIEGVLSWKGVCHTCQRLLARCSFQTVLEGGE